MANTFGSEIDVGPPPVTLRKRRPFGAILVVVLLIVLAVAGGWVWLNLDMVSDMVHGSGHPVVAGGSNADVMASAPEPGVSSADFSSFQQQTSGSIQAATDLLNAQQAELKQMSDQIQGLTNQVSSLTAKIDQMQPARAMGGAPVAAAAAVAKPVVPRPVPAAPRKRMPVDRPAGAVSVGGAPLNAVPAR